MRIFLICLCVIVASATPLLAASPKEIRQKEALEQSEEKRQAAEANAKKIAAEREQLETEQASIKEELVSLNKTLQQHEQKLAVAERELAAVDAAIRARESGLDSQQDELQAMMLAAVRLSQVPPNAVMMMPEFNNKTIEAATALKQMIQSIQEQTILIRKEMSALKKDKKEAETMRSKAANQATQLTEQRLVLDKKLKTKTSLFKELAQDQKAQEALAKTLAKESSTLKQLISNLEKALVEERQQKQKEPSARPDKNININPKTPRSGGTKNTLRPFKAAKGDIRPPSAGRLVSKFNSQDGEEHSKGIIIETPKDGTISAPYDGEVVFTGAFRRYGNMIILKHSDGFHTLIAGLKNIRAKNGEMLLEGEPLGDMGAKTNERQLYVELRENNQPINPANWFDGL